MYRIFRGLPEKDKFASYFNAPGPEVTLVMWIFSGLPETWIIQTDTLKKYPWFLNDSYLLMLKR